ncbi:S-protein homolog 5-like [Arachis hypogaea]|uniref:S-protein homolog 5-like n=1 Tax=Arachis hypogaea TaxID=3818 RepID=UPI000DED0F6B|nr:S-protein homolog 5-like [Arachis hypogaea]
MSISVSKVVVSLCTILGLLICFKFNACVIDDGIFPPLKVTVTIINNLSGGKQLTVHCKDKKNDFGFKELQVGQNWSFIFPPWFTSLYFCSFAWSTGFHYFDIYVHNRDIYRCKHCIWDIYELGPCRETDLKLDKLVLDLDRKILKSDLKQI